MAVGSHAFLSNLSSVLLPIFLILASVWLPLFSERYIYQNAYGDGLSFENIPPSVVAGRPISLFIKVNPPIMTSETRNNTSVQLRLIDPTNNETMTHVTYGVHLLKGDQDLMLLKFHSHSGPLRLEIHQKDGPIEVLNGEKEQTHGSWLSKDGEPDGVLDVAGPIIQDSGLYHFQITVLGMTDDQNFFDPGIAPTFDSWLSIGESFETKIQYNKEDHDITIISYYDKLNQFSYDPTTYKIFWSMPFNYNLDRIQDPNNNIFVHEEVRVPKSLITFLNSTSFVATVNQFQLNGKGVAVDPYSSESEYIVHYLVNKQAIVQLAQDHAQETGSIESNSNGDNRFMNFSLSINTNVKENRNEITSSQVLTTSGIRVNLTWRPSNLTSNQDSLLDLSFVDVQNITTASNNAPITGNIRYSLSIIDRNGDKILQRDNLLAINGHDTQSIRFPADDAYQILVNLTAIEANGIKPDESRNGIGTGTVVVPEFPLPQLGLLIGTAASYVMIYWLKKK